MPIDARETLLLVDDDAAFRAVYTELLRGEGFAVIEAANAEDAVAKAGRARIVVLDLMLPPTGAPEAGAKAMDAIVSAKPETKVIVVSGAGENAFALSLVRRG